MTDQESIQTRKNLTDEGRERLEEVGSEIRELAQTNQWEKVSKMRNKILEAVKVGALSKEDAFDAFFGIEKPDSLKNRSE